MGFEWALNALEKTSSARARIKTHIYKLLVPIVPEEKPELYGIGR